MEKGSWDIVEGREVHNTHTDKQTIHLRDELPVSEKSTAAAFDTEAFWIRIEQLRNNLKHASRVVAKAPVDR